MNNIQKTQIKVEKPWGYEIIFTPPNSKYTGKLIHLNKGSRFSLQYHKEKDETLVLISGRVKITLGTNVKNLKEKEMKKFYGYFIPKGLIHRCQGITESDIIEVSTPEKGITFRLEDDYKRSDETEEERLKLRKLNNCP